MQATERHGEHVAATPLAQVSPWPGQVGLASDQLHGGGQDQVGVGIPVLVGQGVGPAEIVGAHEYVRDRLGEYGRLLVCGGKLRTAWAGRWEWPGGFEHGPDDLAAVGGGQNSDGARESGDHEEPPPVQVKLGEPLTWQLGAVVSNGQAKAQ